MSKVTKMAQDIIAQSQDDKKILNEIKQNIIDATALDWFDWKKTAIHNFEQVHVKDAIARMAQVKKSEAWGDLTDSQQKYFIDSTEKFLKDLFTHLRIEIKKFDGH